MFFFSSITQVKIFVNRHFIVILSSFLEKNLVSQKYEICRTFGTWWCYHLALLWASNSKIYHTYLSPTLSPKILVASFLPIVDTLLGFNLWDANNCVNIFCHQFVVIQFRYTLDTLLYFNIYSSQNQGATDTVRRTYRPSSIKISPEL